MFEFRRQNGQKRRTSALWGVPTHHLPVGPPAPAVSPQHMHWSLCSTKVRQWRSLVVTGQPPNIMSKWWLDHGQPQCTGVIWRGVRSAYDKGFDSGCLWMIVNFGRASPAIDQPIRVLSLLSSPRFRALKIPSLVLEKKMHVAFWAEQCHPQLNSVGSALMWSR